MTCRLNNINMVYLKVVKRVSPKSSHYKETKTFFLKSMFLGCVCINKWFFQGLKYGFLSHG